MPTETSRVGAQTIPLPTGGANSIIADPTLDGLLAFCGFLIKDALDAKLAEMGGPVDSSPITDACPVAHRFPWDHESTFVRPLPGQTTPPLPGLWAWDSQPAKVRDQTLYQNAAERTITVQYIFPQLAKPLSMNARHGLLTAVGNVFQRAATRGAHPSFAIGSDPLGTSLYQSLNLFSWTFMSGDRGFLEPIPLTTGASYSGQRGNAGGAVQRGYPAYQAVFQIVERIENVQPSDSDQLQDSTLAINLFDDDPADTLDAMDRVLVFPDGSRDGR